jgi:uncharacterized protein DUF4154
MKCFGPLDQVGEQLGWSWRLYRRTWRLSLFLVVWGIVLTTALQAESVTGQLEYRVKLAFLYNFTKFVEWPAGAYRNQNAPLTICIVGDDPFNSVLEDELRTRKVGEHPVEIRNLRPDDTIGAFQMVFIPLTAKDQTAGIMKALKGSSTLMVGETEGFATQGGIINFAVEGNRLHLEINPQAAQRAGLKLSSKLLSISTIVKER